MKKYYELLSEYIDKSGLTITELANQLKAKGFTTDRSYISRLKNNSTPPASDELNKAIAEITGNDCDQLIFLAYLDKAPDILNNFVNSAYQLEKELEMEILFSLQDDDSFLRGDNKITKFLMEQNVHSSSGKQVMDLIQKKLTIFEKWQLFNLLADKTTLLDHPLSAEFSTKYYFSIQELVISNKKIPAFKKVYGPGLYMKEDYLGAEGKIENDKYSIVIEVPDSSLENAGITAGSLAHIELTNEINQKNIFLVSYQDSPAKLRKIQFHNEYLFLRPLNDNFEVEFVEKNSVHIIGKLVEVHTTKTFV